VRPEPATPKERAADECIQFLERRLAEEGLTLDLAFLTFKIEEKDADGHNATTVFHAEGDEENLPDLFAFLLAQLKGIGKELGLNIVIGKISGGPSS
jgi:hypothetical protein